MRPSSFKFLKIPLKYHSRLIKFPSFFSSYRLRIVLDSKKFKGLGFPLSPWYSLAGVGRLERPTGAVNNQSSQPVLQPDLQHVVSEQLRGQKYSPAGGLGLNRSHPNGRVPKTAPLILAAGSTQQELCNSIPNPMDRAGIIPRLAVPKDYAGLETIPLISQ